MAANVQLISNPTAQSTNMIAQLNHLHQQGQALAVGDSLVGQPMPEALVAPMPEALAAPMPEAVAVAPTTTGGAAIRPYALKGRGKKVTIYATSAQNARMLGFDLLAQQKPEQFVFAIDGVKYRGYRKRYHNPDFPGIKFTNEIRPAGRPFRHMRSSW